MEYPRNLKPGKRENAFYVKSRLTDEEKVGVQSSKNKNAYIYVWDPEKKAHVGKLITK